MTKTILITVAGIVIFLIFSMWIYLLVFGTPTSTSDVFVDLGVTARTDTPRQITTGPVVEEQVVNTTGTGLRQITTRPVAGFGFVEHASSTPHVYYAEAGTGHVYDIDLESGTETRILGKTFSSIAKAVFAPDGRHVVLIAEDGADTTAYLEEVSDDTTPETFSLPADATHVSFASTSTLLYTRTSSMGMTGYALNLISHETTQRFAVPFTDASVIWGDATYVFNNPAPYLTGAIYRIENGTLVRVGEMGYSLTAIGGEAGAPLVRTSADAKTGVVTSYFRPGSGETKMAIAAFPEKCTFDVSVRLWCGAPFETPGREFLSEWYMGRQLSQDLLWRVDPTTGDATVMSDFLRDTGRIIDIDAIAVDGASTNVLFRNKLDGALWLYPITN
jgi:hypothetical protein